jgi:uncharacterized membrane protein YcfT
MAEDRIRWVQCARGLTISLVVLGHMIYGVDSAVGIDPTAFLLSNTSLAMFRMPLFFFIAGIFAFRSIARPTSTFLDRTVLHLVWIYLVWSFIHWGIKAPFGDLGNNGLDPDAILHIAYAPINVLWFIYALLLYFLVTRLLRDVPGFVLVALAATIAAVPYQPELKWIQRTSNLYVFFVMGYVGSEMVLERARALRPIHALALVPAFAATAVALVLAGVWSDPSIWFAGGLFGILAMISLCVALAPTRIGDLMAFLGNHSLPIFVCHTIVGPTTRVLLQRGGITDDPTLLILICTVVAVGAPVILAIAAERVGFPWLFRKPSWFTVQLRTALEGPARPRYAVATGADDRQGPA